MQLFDNYHIDDRIADAVWEAHLESIAKLRKEAVIEETDSEETKQSKRKKRMDAAVKSIQSKLAVVMADMQVLLQFWVDRRLVFVDKNEGMFREEHGCPFVERFQRVATFMEEIDEEAKFNAAKRLVQCGTEEEARDAMEQLKLDCEI